MISACRTENTYNQPGANARIGSVLVRYAHIAEPPDGPWQTGGDAPLYLWLYNEGDRPDTLLGAGTAVAESVVIIGPDGGRAEDRLPLPPREPTELEEGSTPMVLRDLRQQIRGGDPSGSRLPAQAANGAEPVARR